MNAVKDICKYNKSMRTVDVSLNPLNYKITEKSDRILNSYTAKK